MSNIDKDLFNMKSKIRYRFPLKKGSKVIILAAHSDDETIGCAGTITYFKKYEIEVTIVLFTKPCDTIEAEVRLEEFKNATEFLGCSNSFILGFPDGHLQDYFNDAKVQLDKIISDRQPDMIFTPYLLDYHPDHKCVCKILAELVKEKTILIAMYEVWVPILHPDCYIDISEAWESKLTALDYYQSQEEKYSITSKAKILNQLRAELSMRRQVKYIESFKCLQGERFYEATSIWNRK